MTKPPRRDRFGRYVKKGERPSRPYNPLPPQVCPCGKPCKKNCKICPECRADSAQKARMQYQLQIRRWKERIDREAEAETVGLRDGEPLPPVVAENIISRWQREGR